ncbi:MAG: polyisoprenoid-binding protein [Acidobacteriaceae bacterium]|nr:polyisoprenoid-binding protein [Acidobacteriaceae bacterium]
MQATYAIDPAHSSVQFSVRHMMISNVKGAFTGVKGTVKYDPDAPETSAVQVEIDASTINTLDPTRDTHLKSADFLDAGQFPHITFKSTRVERNGDGLKIQGDLTVHGVTKPVILDVDEITAEGKDPWGNTRIGTSAKAKIKRSDFGLEWNAALETGGLLVGDDLKLDFEVQLIKQAGSATSAA